MGSTDDQVYRITDTAKKVMFKYHHLFPIVDTLKSYAEKTLNLKDDDLKLFVYGNIDSRIGMSEIANKKLSGLNEFWWSIKTSQMDDARISVMKSVLLVYAGYYPSLENAEAFKKIKDEELIW